MEDWIGIAKICGFADEASMLHFFYVKESLPIAEIAKKLGVGQATISHRLEKHRIEKRSRGGANNAQRLGMKMHRMDQRVLFTAKDTVLAGLLNAHPSTVYKHKREVKGVHKPWNSAISHPSPVLNNGEQH